MIAIIESPELKKIFDEDDSVASMFASEEDDDIVYVSITNVVYVLDHHGLQLKLVRRGIDLVVQTAGVQEV